MFDDHDREPFVCQFTEGKQGFVGGGRVEAGEGFIEQENVGLHCQHAGEGDLLFLSAGGEESFLVFEVQDMQALEGFVGFGEHFFAGHALRFQAETDFVEHIGAQNLAFGVLQERTDVG